MLQRKSQMKRGDTPMKRSQKPMTRTRLNPVSEKKRARLKVQTKVKNDYFRDYGWTGTDGKRVARCLICWDPMQKRGSDTHHKILKSHGGTEEPSNLLPCHRCCHAWLHDGNMGDGTTPAARARLSKAGFQVASAANVVKMEWTAEEQADLDRKTITIRREHEG